MPYREMSLIAVIAIAVAPGGAAMAQYNGPPIIIQTPQNPAWSQLPSPQLVQPLNPVAPGPVLSAPVAAAPQAAAPAPQAVPAAPARP